MPTFFLTVNLTTSLGTTCLVTISNLGWMVGVQFQMKYSWQQIGFGDEIEIRAIETYDSGITRTVDLPNDNYIIQPDFSIILSGTSQYIDPSSITCELLSNDRLRVNRPSYLLLQQAGGTMQGVCSFNCEFYVEHYSPITGWDEYQDVVLPVTLGFEITSFDIHVTDRYFGPYSSEEYYPLFQISNQQNTRTLSYPGYNSRNEISDARKLIVDYGAQPPYGYSFTNIYGNQINCREWIFDGEEFSARTDLHDASQTEINMYINYAGQFRYGSIIYDPTYE